MELFSYFLYGIVFLYVIFETGENMCKIDKKNHNLWLISVAPTARKFFASLFFNVKLQINQLIYKKNMSFLQEKIKNFTSYF